ncbi:hypothetical protein, partial [Klebsiella pneumoniae]|uniref:hypothetical protein n=1 Tax=Klebsiella pneumoniae TaxID=573 RepID=UPI001D0EF4AA
NYDFPYVEESDIQEELLYRDPMTRWASSPSKVDNRHDTSNFLYANAFSRPFSLSSIKIIYDVPKIFQLRNSRDRAICDPLPNFISVYLAHLKVGLKFPVIPLLRDICVYWQ